MSHFVSPQGSKHSSRAKDASPVALVLAAIVAVPIIAIAIVLFYVFVALVGAPAMLLLWNYGLTTFLSAAGLGTVAKIGFWEAFRIGLLTTWFGVLVGFVGRGGRTKKDG